MSILSAQEIRELAMQYNMIYPYCEQLIRTEGGQPVVSYGQSSFGYDIRCSGKFKIFSSKRYKPAAGFIMKSGE